MVIERAEPDIREIGDLLDATSAGSLYVNN